MFCSTPSVAKILAKEIPILTGRNTSDCCLSPPSHFFFVRKQKKTVLTKIRLRMTRRNTSDLFSVPPGKLSYRFQTFRQSYLKKFSHIRRIRQNATKCDIALCRIDIPFCRILSHFFACDEFRRMRYRSTLMLHNSTPNPNK